MTLSRQGLGAILIGVALVALSACGPAMLAQSASSVVTVTVTQPAVPSSPTQTVASGTVATTHSSTRATAAARSSSHSSVAAGSTTKAASAQIPVAVYFTAGSSLVKETRQVPAASPARGSMEALLAGPKEAGHFSQAPAGTRLLSINLAAGTATVSFSQEVQSLEGSPAIPLFLAQVVDTLTQFPDVQRVVLEVNGQPLRSLGGEGVSVPEPLDRATVQRMLTGT